MLLTQEQDRARRWFLSQPCDAVGGNFTSLSLSLLTGEVKRIHRLALRMLVEDPREHSAPRVSLPSQHLWALPGLELGSGSHLGLPTCFWVEVSGALLGPSGASGPSGAFWGLLG